MPSVGPAWIGRRQEPEPDMSRAVREYNAEVLFYGAAKAPQFRLRLTRFTDFLGHTIGMSLASELQRA